MKKERRKRAKNDSQKGEERERRNLPSEGSAHHKQQQHKWITDCVVSVIL